MAVFTGTDGADTLTGGPEIDRLEGGGGADVLSGGDGSDVIDGGAGDDLIYGHGSADVAPDSGVIGAARVASGLAQPVFAASPPGDPDRLFILEKDEGRIRVLDLRTNTLEPTPFLDLPQSEFSGGGERGVLGLAFHPDYAVNGRFFVYLTTPSGDLQVREYARSGQTGGADPGSGRVILTVPHPSFSNHNGGWIGFGPDGMLYIATGDGGGTGDPGNNAQNIDSLLGKVLRIDVSADGFPSDPGRNYAIPADNPFVGRAGADEIFAYGLRNPFRASFDRATGDLWIGDVGQSAREEIDFVAGGSRGGQNFGWRILEGNNPYNPSTPPGVGDPSLVAPLLDYQHGPGLFNGVSVTGGQVNRGPGGAQGLYVFSDFVSGNVWTVREADGFAQDFLNRNAQLRPDAGSVNQIAAVVEDGRGRLYGIGLDGEVHRLDFSEAAGDGGDMLNGGEGNDTIHGGAGNDGLGGGVGADLLTGGMGADVIQGGGGTDRLDGGAGNDLLGGGPDNDVIDGGDGDDFIGGEAGDDVISGGLGIDVLFGDDGRDLIGGKDGGDSLFGQGGDDFMGGEAGNDFLDGGDGDDALFGDGGGDTALGGPGADGMFGQDGDDRLSGQDGDDHLDGGSGADRLSGDSGRDTILAGSGDDVVIGGAGADRLAGADGRDRFVLLEIRDSVLGEADLIVDFDRVGGDQIDLSSIDANLALAGDQAFAFVRAFSGQAGQAVLSYDAGADLTTLLLDVNGDGVEDGRLLIVGDAGDGSTGFLT